MLGGLLIAALALPCLALALADGAGAGAGASGKLLLNSGVSQLEGAAGGGLTP